MDARESILAIAESHVGKREVPRNSNQIEFAAEYGISGMPWCAAFVSSVYKAAGYPIFGPRTIEGFTYCPRAVNYARESGEVIEVGTDEPPLPGDVVLFDWGGDRWRRPCPDEHAWVGTWWVGDHVGILRSFDGDTVTCIEGNTMPDEIGDQGEGGGVYVRERPLSLVACFWRPASLRAISPIEPPPPEDVVLTIHQPHKRPVRFSDPDFPAPCDVLDWTYLPPGSTVHVAPLDPRTARFNAVLYTAAGRSELREISFEGTVFNVAAAGRASLVYPPEVDGQLDVFAREVR